MKKILLFSVLALYSVGSLPVHADTTLAEDAQNSMKDAQKNIKKGGRRAKKSVRDATGHSSKTEDAKDKARNAGDDISTSAKKAKDKID